MDKETLLAFMASDLEMILHLTNSIRSDNRLDNVVCNGIVRSCVLLAERIHVLAGLLGIAEPSHVSGMPFREYVAEFLR